MAWEVEYTAEFEAWFDGLTEAQQDKVFEAGRLLEERGPALGYPYSSDVKGSRHGQMRELRVQIGGDPFRVFYAFDPRRTAILLIGAEKTGLSNRAFYAAMVPIADRLYDEYLVELKREGILEDG